MAYTFQTQPNGNVDVFQDGKHISTGTVDYAASTYGYQPNPPATPQNAPQATPVPSAAPQPTSAPAPAPAPAQPQPATPVAYTGPSIVDYLNSIKQPSNFTARANLALQHGIQGYSGTAVQNTQLLNTLRAKNPVPVAASGTPQATNTPAAAPVTPATSPAAVPVTPATSQATPGATIDTTRASSATPASATPTGPVKSPVQEVIDTYTQVYNSLGLGDIKTRFQDVVKQQDAITKELNDKIADTRANPWLSQGVSDRTVRNLQDRYAARLDAFTHLSTLYDSLLKEGQAQAQFLVGHIEQDKHNAMIIAEKRQEAIDALAKDNIVVNANGRELLVSKATGKTIADLGASKALTPTEQYGTGSIGEYNFAKANGYKGSFIQYQNEDANRKKTQPTTVVISPGVSDAINKGLLAPSDITRGNLPILNQLYKDHPEFNTNTANANQAALKQLQKQETLTTAFESTARNNLDLADNLSDKVGRTGSTLLNEWQLYIQGKLGSNSDVLSFQTAVKTATNEYAKVITGQTTGQAVSDSARTETEKLLNAAYSPVAFKAIIATMKQEMKNRLQGFTDSKNALKGGQNNSSASDFFDIQSSITIQGQNAYIPRSIWSTLGVRQDALIKEAKADGYNLLVK